MSMQAVTSAMSAVASSSSDESPNVLAFPDRFAGRRVSIVLVIDGILQSPKKLFTQIMRPLELIQAAAWFCSRQSPGMKRHREEPPPPLGHMLTEFSPCASVRVMCGCVAIACCRLATAPAGVYVMHRTTGRWAAWIMERVTRGRVKKVQVLLQRLAWCTVRCACRASACVRCVYDACCRNRWLILSYVVAHRSGRGVHSFVQAAAAARVAGGRGILNSVQNRDGVSVLCHVIADADAVNERSLRQ
jgi:hypothetical protein